MVRVSIFVLNYSDSFRFGGIFACNNSKQQSINVVFFEFAFSLF